MPRSLSKYTVREWFRLRPLVDRKNHARYQIRERIALATSANPVALPLLRGRKALITISFNDAEVIDWQTKLVARHVPDAIHVIADNSNDPAQRTAIRAICEAVGLTYVAVPNNPWGKRKPDGSKSHGFALNWAWANIVLANRPSMVGFLDHDIFPVEKTDPFRMLENAAVGGVVRTVADGRWYLWPGYAFFRLDRLSTTRLNFGKDWLDDLDTGGLNWGCLYRTLNGDDFCKASFQQLPISDDIPMEEALFDRIDDWVHENCYSTTIHMDAARRRYLLDLKRRHTAAALSESPSASS